MVTANRVQFWLNRPSRTTPANRAIRQAADSSEAINSMERQTQALRQAEAFRLFCSLSEEFQLSLLGKIEAKLDQLGL
jgi:hypothetical protein